MITRQGGRVRATVVAGSRVDVEAALRGKRGLIFTRSVRITFNRTLEAFRADECLGDWVTEAITEGWVSEELAEDLAALYAAIRGLPVSRVDFS